uniref:Uncharacterized protein n=1 Tax=Anguilla anguilla TaxID=7936 RepID=A0A0E9UC56_ANGAN
MGVMFRCPHTFGNEAYQSMQTIKNAFTQMNHF